MRKVFDAIKNFFVTVKPSEKLKYSFDYYGKESLNFGIVLKDLVHIIYRSHKLDNDDIKELFDHLDEKGLRRPKTIIHMNKNGYGGWASFFLTNAIEEYNASFSYGFDFYHPFHPSLRTYLDGHNPFKPKSDIDNQKWGNSDALKLFDFGRKDGPDGGIDELERILQVVIDPKAQPVLFHCQGGRHRTGMIAMIIRNFQGGIWVNGLKTAMKIDGKKYFLAPYEYEYYRHNKELMRSENIDFVREYVKTESFAALKARFREFSHVH